MPSAVALTGPHDAGWGNRVLSNHDVARHPYRYVGVPHRAMLHKGGLDGGLEGGPPATVPHGKAELGVLTL